MPVTGNQLTKAALLASINADIKNNPVTLIRGDVMAQKIADIEESSVNILTDYSTDYSVVVRQTPAGISNVAILPDSVLGRVGTGRITSIVLFGGSVNQVTVDAATTGNITLSGNQTIDGVVNPATVLVQTNTDPTENGTYNTGAGAWTRMTSADTAAELDQQEVFVTGGNTYTGRIFFQIEPLPDPITDPKTYQLGVIGGNGNNGSFWSLVGNANTPASNKLGSRNNVAVRFFQNNILSGRIDTSKNFDWGSASQFLLNSSGRITKYNNAAPTDGQLLIGDTAAGYFKSASLSAGSNIAITPGAGTISIAVTGLASNPLTTTGDIIYSSDNSGTPTRLGIGSTGQALTVSAGGIPEWTGPGGALTATQIAFGNGSNVMTSSANLTYTSADGLKVIGTGATSATNALLIQNSSGFNQFVYRDDGWIMRGDQAGTLQKYSAPYVGTGNFADNTTWGYQAGNGLTTGQSNTLIGTNAGVGLTSQNGNTLVGSGSLGSGTRVELTAMGLSSTGADYSVAIGSSAQAGTATSSQYYNVAIGYSSHVNGFNTSVSLGALANCTASNQMMWGAPGAKLSDIYWGGFSTVVANLSAYTLHTPGVDAGISNGSAATSSLIMQPGPGTGTGVGADFIVKTSPAGTTGTSQNAAVAYFTVKGDGTGVVLDGTTAALLLTRLTSTQRDAITPVKGMTIYNTTIDKFQGYDGAWTSFE